MEIPNIHLKVIFFVHLVLITWGMSVLPPSYHFYNLVFVLVLLWGIHHQESEEPIFMGLVINGGSIVLDMMYIIIFYPNGIPFQQFCIGMAILNLILRPISCVMLHRIRNERAGSYSNYGVPGLGDYFGRRGPYENIDHTTSQSVPQATVDTGSPQNFSTEKPISPP